MRMRKMCAGLSLALTLAMALPLAAPNAVADAAKKPSLQKSLSLKVGASKTIKVKNYKKKVTWKSSKAAVAKLSAIKKTSVKVTGKKAGSAVVSAKFKVGKKNTTLKCKVKVSPKAPKVTEAPPVVDVTPVPAPTIDPDATPTPTPTFDYDSYKECTWKLDADGKTPLEATIKDTFENYFKVGVSTDLGSLRFGESAAYVRHHFNSVSMGNETKMEATVSVKATDEYPDGLAKANVDNYYATNGEGRIILNYDNIEKVCSYLKANGLQMRYHAFVWHSQVSEYFFLQDYNWSDYDEDDYAANGWDVSNYHKLCDPDTMKKRLNDYISQVIEYIYSHGYGDVVYAYDVINEATNGGGNYVAYTFDENKSVSSVDELLTRGGSPNTDNGNGVYCFQTNGGVKTSSGKTVTENSSPAEIEDMVNKNGRVPANDSYWYATMGVDYLYLCYLDAYNAIKTNFEKYKGQFGYKNMPSLIYNDYNQSEKTQMGLVKWINAACNLANGTDGIKYCSGIGLQSHSVGESAQERMIKYIVDKGYEVQITELDEGADGDAQATKLKNVFKLYMKYSKNGEYGKTQGDDYIGVTSVTNWGICDGDGSWSGDRIHYLLKPIEYPEPEEGEEEEEHILNLQTKPAFYGVLQAGNVDCGARMY